MDDYNNNAYIAYAAPLVDPALPVVVISNFAEAHVDFLGRSTDPAERAALIDGESSHGDRTLLWVGDPKLVFVSYPIAHADYMCQSLGYPQTRHLAPAEPTHWLCLDILREPALLQGLIEYSGPHRTVQLIPYATTPEFFKLVAHLRKEYGVTALLPESPMPEDLWLRDYSDTKAGFRLLASRWLPDSNELLLPGFVCASFKLAAQAANWFCSRGKACVVKADTGESGVGHSVIRPQSCPSLESLAQEIEQNSFLGQELILVEEYVLSGQMVSPSLELFVPPLGQAEPHITYLSNQLFREFGDFCGVLVSKELLATPWYPPLERSGLSIAKRLQEMGYVGHFDLDTVVDNHDQIYLLEINSRRTGGTHVHEFARHAFGEHYLEQVTLLSHEAMPSYEISRAEDLLAALSELLYPMQGQARGVVITITTTLIDRQFGCIILGASTEEALDLQRAIHERLRQSSPP